MPPTPAYTRRQFLHAGLAMVSTVGTVPTFLSRSGTLLAADTSMRLSSKPGDDRVLVVVQLSGGNDGLNTVIPFGDDRYYRARPALRIVEGDVIPLHEAPGIGLHPALRPLHELIGDGRAAVVQGVGYPNPNRSHFASMDVWHSGIAPAPGSNGTSSRLPKGTGWIGRALDHADTLDPALGCVSIGTTAPMATQGKSVKPVAFERSELFQWSARGLHPDLAAAYDALHESGPVSLQRESGSQVQDEPAAFIHRTACDAQIASAKVRSAVGKRSETRFPRTGLGRQLEAVAAMIRAELPTRVYYVAMGGFDTHANQANQHQRLLAQFAEAMKAFDAELGASDQRGRVVTLAFSEFGRRVAQNASGGTDHGTAGPAFVFGESIRPGLTGTTPSLANLDDGDLIHTTDFRSLYTELLSDWLRMNPTVALGKAYRPTTVLAG